MSFVFKNKVLFIKLTLFEMRKHLKKVYLFENKT